MEQLAPQQHQLHVGLRRWNIAFFTHVHWNSTLVWDLFPLCEAVSNLFSERLVLLKSDRSSFGA